MLKRGIFFCLLFISLTASSQTYYIVRHAEKAQVNGNPNMSASNPPLSDMGKERAEALKDELKDKHITKIFSTDFIRTLSTAGPLSQAINVPVITYQPQSFEKFEPKGNNPREDSIKILIVGHSNTVDDIVNFLCKAQKISGDLSDDEYDNLFIVTIRNGVATFERKKYGRRLIK